MNCQLTALTDNFKIIRLALVAEKCPEMIKRTTQFVTSLPVLVSIKLQLYLKEKFSFFKIMTATA